MLYSVGVSAWDKVRNDPALDNAGREKLVDLGLASIKKALDLQPEYFEAMVYYDLLLPPEGERHDRRASRSRNTSPWPTSGATRRSS